MQACGGEQLVDLLRRRRRRERLDRARDPNSEDASGMQRLPQRGVVHGQIPCQRVDGEGRSRVTWSTRSVPWSTKGRT